jgi:hypothetical protein
VEDERKKIVAYSLMLFFFPHDDGWGVAEVLNESVCNSNGKCEGLTVCTPSMHIYTQQHRFYAFLSTFLLKSLPGSSLWLVLLPKNRKP